MKEENILLYKVIYRDLKERIEKGIFRTGSRLPSIRALSLRYKVNNLTVQKAFGLLEQDNCIVRKQGAGIFVKERDPLFYNNPHDLIVDCFKDGNAPAEGCINFISATPSPALYPIREFRRALNAVLTRDGALALAYHPTQGHRDLREYFRKELALRGAEVPVENIQITNGSQQALDLMLKALITKGHNRIILGDPTYHGALNAFRPHCIIYPVPMTSDGFDMPALERILSKEKISFIFTMMNFSSPMGICWSSEKKKELIRLAAQYGTYIIEDDIAGGLDFKPVQRLCLKSLDEGNRRVIYIRSFSKVLMPGLRLAYLVLPDPLVEKAITVKFTSDISTPGLEQRALLQFLQNGGMGRHLKRITREYRHRCQVLMEELKTLPELTVLHQVEGGVFLWVRLREDINPASFWEACRRQNVLLLPGSLFYAHNPDRHCFRLCFSGPDAVALRDGVSRIRTALGVLAEEKTTAGSLLFGH